MSESNLTSRRLNKNCLHCGNEITSGRIDKKFCDDKCKNLYRSDEKREEIQFFNKTEAILRENHRIIRMLFEEKKASIRCSVEKLSILGFKPQFCTGIKDGKAILYNVQFYKRSKDEFEFVKLP